MREPSSICLSISGTFLDKPKARYSQQKCKESIWSLTFPNDPWPTTFSSSKSFGPTLGGKCAASWLELALELLMTRLCCISASSCASWWWSYNGTNDLSGILSSTSAGVYPVAAIHSSWAQDVIVPLYKLASAVMHCCIEGIGDQDKDIMQQMANGDLELMSTSEAMHGPSSGRFWGPLCRARNGRLLPVKVQGIWYACRSSHWEHKLCCFSYNGQLIFVALASRLLCELLCVDALGILPVLSPRVSRHSLARQEMYNR